MLTQGYNFFTRKRTYAMLPTPLNFVCLDCLGADIAVCIICHPPSMGRVILRPSPVCVLILTVEILSKQPLDIVLQIAVV